MAGEHGKLLREGSGAEGGSPVTGEGRPLAQQRVKSLGRFRKRVDPTRDDTKRRLREWLKVAEQDFEG